jgi:hypothetical protein
MLNKFFNFYYDPVRQGFDSGTWTTVSGSPTITNNRLSLTSAVILHFADLIRGEAAFNIKISAPTAGDDKKFGFIEYSKGAYLYFKVAGAVLTAECSDGTTVKTTAIDWVSDWTNTNTEFKIKWEAGVATFSIGGQLKVQLTTSYTTVGVPDTVIPGDPMCLYLSAGDADILLLNYIDVKGVESADLDVP